MSYVIH